MTPTRLRPAWSADELARIYAAPHDHRIYGRGHHERVEMMKEHVQQLINDPNYDPIPRYNVPMTVADLSCGNADVAWSAAREADKRVPTTIVRLGDIAPGWEFYGPIEQTIERVGKVDLFICGETLEHLDDPIAVLRQIRAVTRFAVLSTPTENWGDTNAEHYWSWSEDDVSDMLREAGFTIVRTSVVDSRMWGEPYRYGIWTCS